MAAETVRKSIEVSIKSMPSIDEIVKALTSVAKMEAHAPLTVSYVEYADDATEQSLVLNAIIGFSSKPFSEHLKLEALDENWMTVTMSFTPPSYGAFATIERP